MHFISGHHGDHKNLDRNKNGISDLFPFNAYLLFRNRDTVPFGSSSLTSMLYLNARRHLSCFYKFFSQKLNPCLDNIKSNDFSPLR